MMGAAESISDLRSLLSIVAEETGALKMNDANEDSVGWTTEGPLPMMFGHVRRAHAALAALEAALSPAEPVAWLPARRWEQMTAAEPWLTNIVYSQDQAKFFPCIPLYTAPPAPSVAVKAFHRQADNMAFIINHVGLPDQWREKFMRELDEDRSALSAQVQDVAGWQPIETAPKDGRTILAYFPLEGLGKHWERVMPVKYRESMMPEPWIFAGRAASSYSTGPTHWMPLPAAPAKQEG